MRTVLVIQDPEGKNLTPARDFGEINIVLRGNESTGVAYLKLNTAIKQCDHTDFLLLIGNPIYIAMASHMWFVHHGKANLLVWNREKYRYDLHDVDGEVV